MSAEAAPRTARKKRVRWAIIALTVLVVIVAAVAVPMFLGGAKKSDVAIATTTVEPGKLVVTASADGQTEADNTYEVYPAVAGKVETVDVALGDRVKAGDKLFTLSDASLQSVVRSANAQLSQAKLQVAQANQQVAQARFQQLQAENGLDKLESQPASMAASHPQIAEAKRSVTVAKASVTSANASLSSAKVARANADKNLADARTDLSKVTVTAPADGIVTGLNVAEGGSVSTGGGTSAASSGASISGGSAGSGTSAASASAAGSASAPVVISDSTKLIATVAVNEVDIADVKAGEEATVTFDAAAGLAIPATVRWVSPNAATSGNVRTYDVELELAEQDKRLRPGMTASAEITTLKLADALLVPKTAVRVDGTSKFVTVVKSDGTQEKRTVTTGRSDELSVQVLTNLKAGEKIASSFVAPAAAAGNSMIPPNPGRGMGGN